MISVIAGMIVEKIRELFPNINILINNDKKILSKSTSGISIF